MVQEPFMVAGVRVLPVHIDPMESRQRITLALPPFALVRELDIWDGGGEPFLMVAFSLFRMLTNTACVLLL